MKWWPLLKQFPKYALVFGLIVGSTVLFSVWWVFHSRKPDESGVPAPVEDIGPKLALVEAKWERLILVDNDLYDTDDGQLIFRHWLQESVPLRVFFDADAKKIIAQDAAGFVRYGLDGHLEARLAKTFPVVFTLDLKAAVYAKDKEVWHADVDWKAFTFTNERKVTSIEQFNESHFAENVALLTAKTLIVRNFNTLLRVNLDTGAVKPTKLPLGEIGSRRSPDSKWVVGMVGEQFYCYDVDADEAKSIQIAWGSAMKEFQWLGNDRCLGLAGGKAVVVYDRLAHSLAEVTALPFPCFKIGNPSPDNRFVFCAGGLGGRDGALVDLERKTATRLNGGAGIAWISNDTFAYSREVPDSELRGIWKKKTGESEKQISAEPYLVSDAGPQLLTLPAIDLTVFETKHGLEKMRPDGIKAGELLKLHQPASHVLGIQKWETE